ncbi:MAG: histidine phosphatase family protein [Betaproteobacteria bacterium]
MILSLIRHGSTSWNEERRIQGRRDIPLSEGGRAQVRAWRIPVDSGGSPRWVSSPLCRAIETAELLNGSAPPQESALVEMDWGDWEGWRIDDLRNRNGNELARREAQGLDFRPPGGESPREVLGRLRPWLLGVAQSDVPVVAVTHLGVLRAVLSLATGWDMAGKPPIRLQGDALHRFSVDARGHVAVASCNIPLASGQETLAS